MAGIAIRGKSLKLAHRCILVALVALHQRVRAYERKPVLVISDCVQ